MPFPAASVAESSAIDTSTAPSAVGVTSKVYTVPLTATKLLAVPFATVRSPSVMPVTDSLKVAVNGIGERFVAGERLEVIVTVGRVVSTIIVLDWLNPGFGRVRVAALSAASLMVPPFNTREFTPACSRSAEFSPAPTVYRKVSWVVPVPLR